MTNEHAKRWTPLREQIMLTGTHRKIFSACIIANGRGIVQVYDEHKLSGRLEEHDIDTPEKYLSLKQRIPDLPSPDLPPGDLNFKLKMALDAADAVSALLDELQLWLRD